MNIIDHTYFNTLNIYFHIYYIKETQRKKKKKKKKKKNLKLNYLHHKL